MLLHVSTYRQATDSTRLSSVGWRSKGKASESSQLCNFRELFVLKLIHRGP